MEQGWKCRRSVVERNLQELRVVHAPQGNAFVAAVAHGISPDGLLPNDEAVVRLVSAVLMEIGDEWAMGRRYFSLETMAKLIHPEPLVTPERAPLRLALVNRTARRRTLAHRPEARELRHFTRRQTWRHSHRPNALDLHHFSGSARYNALSNCLTLRPKCLAPAPPYPAA